MSAVAFLLATVQLALVAFGVTVFGSSELHNLATGLALVAAGLLFGGVPRLSIQKG